MYRIILFFLFILINLASIAQPVDGASGLMKIPSAEMQQDGTFILGANYLPDAVTPEPFDYNTGNYYLNITFLPFLEFTYRSTLLRWDENHNQDRSFGVHLRCLKESRVLPSVVLGGNDLYTSAPGNGNQYFNSFYVVTTKHLTLKDNQFGFTFGYGNGEDQGVNLNGIFGGMSVTPAILPTVRLLAEYDSNVVNAGFDILFFRHLYVSGMAYDLKHFAGGLAYRIYLKDKPKR
jgi:hypothetical protein